VVADTPDALFAEAEQLDMQAVQAGEDSEVGRRLRSQAAALKVKALGARVYPVVICSACFSVTGWTGADGKCDACLRAAQLHAAFSDPHGGWVQVGARRPVAPGPGKSFRAQLSSFAGRGRTGDHAWLSRVAPGDTGPSAPESGYELEVAKRDEVAAVDGSGMVVRFTTLRHRFGGTEWIPLETTRIARGATHVPSEFSAGLPIEQLAEAWGDYRGAVDAFNSAAWSQESARRDATRRAEQLHQETVRDQARVADLLDEN
jgi:hypothetical protein